MSRTSEASPSTAARGRQRHLAVGGAGQRGNVVDLVVAEPRLGLGADVGLPHVALRLLGQAHVRAQQRVHRQRGGAVRLIPARRGSASAGRWVHVGSGASTSRPSGYRTAKSTAAPALCRSATKSAQPVRHLLLPAHAGQRRQPDVEAAGVLLDGVGQQRVRRQFAEDPVAVLQRRLHRGGEADRVAQVVHPVVGVARRQRRAGRTGSRSSTGPSAPSGRVSSSTPASSSRIGSTWGECEATSTATSRAITPRASHSATSSRTDSRRAADDGRLRRGDHRQRRHR